MAQVTDYTVSNQTFPNTRADLNNIFAAIATNNSGTTAPSNQQAGQWWIDTTSSTWILYIHDGTDDIQFATIDTSANTVNFTDSALDVVTDLTPQLGGNLDLNSNDITGTGNINITGNITASGNLAGTLTTASQPNITSVGTLTSFTSTGIDDNATSTAITIDTSENVFIKTTGTGTNIGIDALSTGFYLRDGGQFRAARDNSQSIIANRLNGDGAILDLRKDGNTIGQLSARSGGMGIDVGSTPSEAMRIDSSGNVGIGTTNIKGRMTVSSASNSGEFHVGTNGGTAFGISVLRDKDDTDDQILHFATTENSTKTRACEIEMDYTDNAMIFRNGYYNHSVYDINDANDDSNFPERMRIDSSGRLLVGTTSTTINTSNFGFVFDASTDVFKTSRNTNGGGTSAEHFGNAGQIRFMGDGDAENTNNSYGALSDRTLKENETDANSQWNDIKALQIKNYNLIEYPDRPQIGVIAQDLEEAGMNGLVKTDDEGLKSVKYSVLYMKAVKALQEALIEIDNLKARVNTLEGN